MRPGEVSESGLLPDIAASLLLGRQALLELETPFLKDRVEYSNSPVYFDQAGNLKIGRRPPIQDLRDAVEKALWYRCPQAFIG